ncbi:MAG: PDZ domain-containing protein, partial [Verrucomicrobia bacterium]|nr:PDZ domain-containing protein [Verrucomicrobiota bacterium]
IGLNVAVYPEGSGIGFAIPVKEVSATLSQMFTPELTGSLWFGARVSPGTSPLKISNVQTNSPAWTAGLRPSQQILRINGQTPGSLVEFNQSLVASPHHRAVLTVLQDEERRTLNATLIPFAQLIRDKTGLSLGDATNGAALPTDLFSGKGMAVKQVDPDSPAARAGLQAGMVLTSVDGVAANRLLDVGEALTGHNAGDVVPVTVVVTRRLGENFLNYQSSTVTLQLR